MPHLLLTVRFLDARYHGLFDRDGPPEWPPSPFRLFQALVAGVARRRELVVGDDVTSNTNLTPTGHALDWLQRHTRDHPPIIIAPKSIPGKPITQYVPNNDGDKEFDRQKRLVGKHTQPTLFLLEPDQKPEVHYVWDVSGTDDCPVEAIETAARALTTLGWGIDMAFADAYLVDEPELQKLKGIRWRPKNRNWPFRDTLRVPTYDDKSGVCTLSDLRHCHNTFISRIEHGKPLKTVDKPGVFDRILYTSTERPIGRPCRVFKLIDENENTVAYPQGELIHVAAMVRKLAYELMKRYHPRDLRGIDPTDWARAYVAGHQSEEDREAGTPHAQFSYVPLPSTGHIHTDPAIRRVMIVAPLGDEPWLDHLARYLDGQALSPSSGTNLTGSRLELIPDHPKDGVRDAYTRPSESWASFTPVILPGHDDHKPDKTRKLILKALGQSGIEQPCEFEWSEFSSFPKSYSAHKYDRDRRPVGYIRPDHLLHQTAVHMRLHFDRRVPGPITLGAGRHCGFGLFAIAENQ